MSKFAKSAFGLIVTLAIVGGLIWAAAHRQHIVDQAVVATYNPSSEIVNLAKEADLSNQGQFYFYASRPQLDERQSFNNHCQQQADSGGSSVILGCYVARRIYVFNVTDSRLNGIRATTAAHEMLHAAYERLSDSKKKQVDGWLEAQFKALGSDTDLQTQMAGYAKTEPGEQDNELHSVLATEIAHLSPQLEHYYSQYFKNRQVVVGLFKQYNQVFENLKSQQDQLVSQLNQLANTINTNQANYNAEIAQFNSDVTSFNQRAQTQGGFSSQSEFDAQRQTLVDRQSQLALERANINQEITTYNQKRDELQAVNLQAESLNHSIDSHPQPVPSI